MKYLLDTNACIAAMRNHPLVVNRMASLLPHELAVSTITSYELFTGIEKCADPAKERSKVDLLLRTVTELPFDRQAAQEAARIRAFLESKGLTIGPYDLLLAGQTLSAKLTLVSANTAEFGRVPALLLENWQKTT